MKNSIVILLATFLVLNFAENAKAEIAFAESIDWVVAKSDRVVVGKVVKTDKVKGRKGDCEVVTVAISKTLKGVHAERVTILLHEYHGEYAKQWMDEGIEMVFCLVRNDGKTIPQPIKKFKWILREDGNYPNVILLGKSKHHWTGCCNVLTRDFTVLTKKDAILKYLEKAIKAIPKTRPLRSHTLVVPWKTAVHKKLYHRSAVMLDVPVDKKLENLGRTWSLSKNSRERAEGAKILRYFKNEKNITILKSMLKDPSNAEKTVHRTVPGKSELGLVYRKKVFYVRKLAYAALQEFKIEVKKPVLEVLLEGKNEPDEE